MREALVSAVRVALRARRRQYEIRDHLREREHAAAPSRSERSRRAGELADTRRPCRPGATAPPGCTTRIRTWIRSVCCAQAGRHSSAGGCRRIDASSRGGAVHRPRSQTRDFHHVSEWPRRVGCDRRATSRYRRRDRRRNDGRCRSHRAETPRGRADATCRDRRDVVRPILSRALDGTITSWNAAAGRTFGYTATEAIGRDIAMLVPPERVDEFAQSEQGLEAGAPVAPFETVRLTNRAMTRTCPSRSRA